MGLQLSKLSTMEYVSKISSGFKKLYLVKINCYYDNFNARQSRDKNKYLIRSGKLFIIQL